MASYNSVQPNPKIFLFLLIGLCLFFFIGYTNRLMVFGEEQAKAEEMKNKIEAAELETARLRSFLHFAQTDTYVEQVSRQEFGLSRGGDRMVIILPEAETADEEEPILSDTLPTGESLNEPIWRQWLLLFSQTPS